MITQKELKEFFSYSPDTGLFTRIKMSEKKGRGNIGDVVGNIHSSGYRIISIDGKKYRAHRLAWLYVHGFMPLEIDHINRVKYDNRIVNLRIVTKSMNQKNKAIQKNNTSGISGVHLHKPTGRWQVRIFHHRKRKSLGYYSTREEAISVRKEAEMKFYKAMQPQEPTKDGAS